VNALTDISPDKLLKLRRRLGRSFKEEISDTPELKRIIELPRRIWQEEIYEGMDVEQLVVALTDYLKIQEGEQVLRPVQAKALQEAHDIGGLFGPIPVGDGKTLISFLVPVAMEAERPLLVVPAKLREKTRRDFLGLAEHWKRHPHIPVVSYEKISRENGTRYLEDLNPDLIICDEAHRLRNKTAAVTRRFSQWMEKHPETRMVAMSGTITNRSLLDFDHILRWCLPAELQPLPPPSMELNAWAAAVDVIKPRENRMAANPGALRKLCNAEELQQGREGVRSAVRRRYQETPGVVASPGQEVDASLNIVLSLVDGYNDRILQLAHDLNGDPPEKRGKKPNGEVVTDRDLAVRWQIFRCLTSGFWYEWVPPPPKPWRKARGAWKKNVHDILAQDIVGLESEMLVARAVAGGDERWNFENDVYKTYAAWKAVRDTYEPDVQPVWEDVRMLHAIHEWTRTHRGIIWVSEVALGECIEETMGLPYFRNLGLNKDKRPIEDVDPSEGCVVASVSANSEGRNLQAWAENLVISPPPDGKTWQQLLGRTHRPGQEADEVWVDVFIGCKVEWQCFQQALRDAHYASKMEASKKLTYATIDRFEPPWGENSLWPI